MKDKLTICSDLDHDGDGVVRYRISAENVEFRGSTLAWGNDIDAEKLGGMLKGFPKATPSSIEFSFGSPKTGQCRLEFKTIDNRGNCGVWVSLEAAHASGGTERFQSALICVQFMPANLDEFCKQLVRFKRGRDNEATLG